MQTQNMKLVLSTDAKPRLKWTLELHQRFVEGVALLGGADKATPKSLRRIMGIPGLTLYHLKSHLQKYRVGKSRQTESCSDIDQDGFSEIQSKFGEVSSTEISDGNPNLINESLQITRALQMQMEVQRKLHEQIEVQRHLQFRIEAQGKYLQSVLRKAQETLSGYDSSSVGAEFAKSELFRLALMVNSSCPSSSISQLTEIGTLSPKQEERKQLCSEESSLTCENENEDTNRTSLKLPLIASNHNSTDREGGQKRRGSTISDANYVEQTSPDLSHTEEEKSGKKLRKFGLMEMIDLNI